MCDKRERDSVVCLNIFYLKTQLYKSFININTENVLFNILVLVFIYYEVKYLMMKYKRIGMITIILYTVIRYENSSY